MVKYSFNLKIKDSSINESYSYILNLTPDRENNPVDIFNHEIKQSIRKTLQTKSSCKISDRNLALMINTWIQDIREGYRETYLTLALPLLIEANIDRLNESGNQELPEIIEPDVTEIEPQLGAFPPLIFT